MIFFAPPLYEVSLAMWRTRER